MHDTLNDRHSPGALHPRYRLCDRPRFPVLGTGERAPALLVWTFIALSAAEILVFILWLMYGTRTALVMLVVIPLGGLASLGYAYRLAGRNHVDAAVFVTSALIWTVSLIAGAARGGGLLAVAALLALAPVVVGVAYSSRTAILRIILISV